MNAVNRFRSVAIVSLFILACSASTAGAHESSPAPALSFQEVVLPQSTAIHVTLNETLRSDRSQPGERFEATLSQPVILDGRTIIPVGAQAMGVIVDARRSGRLVGHAHLLIALESVEVAGQSYEIRTGTDTKIGKLHGKHNFGFIGGGAGTGILIGALAAGGGGALIGGPIGAGVGTAAALMTGKRDIRLPAETPVTFELASPATIDLAEVDMAGSRGKLSPASVTTDASE
jgi:hypothetical protein